MVAYPCSENRKLKCRYDDDLCTQLMRFLISNSDHVSAASPSVVEPRQA